MKGKSQTPSRNHNNQNVRICAVGILLSSTTQSEFQCVRNKMRINNPYPLDPTNHQISTLTHLGNLAFTVRDAGGIFPEMGISQES